MRPEPKFGFFDHSRRSVSLLPQGPLFRRLRHHSGKTARIRFISEFIVLFMYTHWMFLVNIITNLCPYWEFFRLNEDLIELCLPCLPCLVPIPKDITHRIFCTPNQRHKCQTNAKKHDLHARNSNRDGEQSRLTRARAVTTPHYALGQSLLARRVWNLRGWIHQRPHLCNQMHRESAVYSWTFASLDMSSTPFKTLQSQKRKTGRVLPLNWIVTWRFRINCSGDGFEMVAITLLDPLIFR